jgi:hypothetical protein
MKNATIVALFLLLISCNAKEKENSNRFIGFYHIGKTTGIYKPLLVGTKLVNIHLTEKEAATIRHSKDPASMHDQRQLYFTSKHVIAITDKTTDSVLRTFIYSHQKYFITAGEYKKSADDDTFMIMIDSKDKRLINPDLAPAFFGEIRNTLKNMKCDEIVIHFLP